MIVVKDNYTPKAWHTQSYVVNIANFNINVLFFSEDASLSQKDEDLLLKKTLVWKSQKSNYGSEFLRDENGNPKGFIKYGLIQ